jgi:integrase
MKRHYRVAVDLLQDGLDDLIISEIARADVVDVIVLISQLPKSHGKSAKEALRLRELVSATNAAEAAEIEIEVQRARENGGDRKTIARAQVEARIERLKAQQSLHNHRARINSFLNWCHKQGYLPQPLQIDLDDIPREVRDEAKNRDQNKGARMSWGRDKLQALLTSSIMTDPHKDFGDPMFWAILAGPHQAPRMEEFLQLGPDDIEVREQIPVMLIRPGLGGHAKTDAARRVVPIHPILIAAGFLELVEQRRSEKSHWLFPMLDHGHDGRFSSIFTKRFSRYREDEGLYDPERDYHSFRSDFQETLEDADVPPNARKRMMGHRVEDITEGEYRKRDYPITRKAEYINLIDYGIEVERVNGIPVVKLRGSTS